MLAAIARSAKAVRCRPVVSRYISPGLTHTPSTSNYVVWPPDRTFTASIYKREEFLAPASLTTFTDEEQMLREAGH